MTQHTVKHHPVSATGYQVCDCGATRRVENGTPKGTWHVCELCVPTTLLQIVHGK